MFLSLPDVFNRLWLPHLCTGASDAGLRKRLSLGAAMGICNWCDLRLPLVVAVLPIAFIKVISESWRACTH